MIKAHRQNKVKFHINPNDPIVVESLAVEESNQLKAWIPDLSLKMRDKDILLSSEWVSDDIVNAAHILLQKCNPILSGLQDVTCGLTMHFSIERGEFVQILHDGHGHWLTISTIGVKHPNVCVFDSLYPTTSTRVKMQIASLLFTEKPKITLEYQDVQKQSGLSDCGLFAIAFATALCFGRHPGELMFDQSKMRSYLMSCFQNRNISMFPIKKIKRTATKRKPTELINVYCICRMPEFTGSRWIQCSSCKEWFHCGTCVKVPPMPRVKWNCQKCT